MKRLFKKVEKDLIGIWRLHIKGNPVKWCCSYKLCNDFYDTKPYNTVEEALKEVYEKIRHLKDSSIWFIKKCSRCGSERHNQKDYNCCRCWFFVAPNQRCKKGTYTTREGQCTMFKIKYGNIPPSGG